MHASSIVKAVKGFGESDFDTLLFGKLLKGSVPEGYRGMVETVKKGVYEAIKTSVGQTQTQKITSGAINMDQQSIKRCSNWLTNLKVIDQLPFDVDNFWQALLTRQRKMLVDEFKEL